MLQGLFFGLFFPAGVGLAWRLATTTGLETQVLLLATLLLSVEQARAATVDLQNIGQVVTALDDDRLPPFRRLTWVVIGLELLGFYTASLNLGWGMLIVLVSQVLFNGFAQIALFPQAVDKIKPWGAAERRPVLMANLVGLLLASAWALGTGRLFCAIALLLIVLTYLIIKYTSAFGQPA
ncbi:MAG: hypothetical protein AAFU71_08905 [Cyanobacteria bacterium J06632_22]